MPKKIYIHVTEDDIADKSQAFLYDICKHGAKYITNPSEQKKHNALFYVEDDENAAEVINRLFKNPPNKYFPGKIKGYLEEEKNKQKEESVVFEEDDRTIISDSSFNWKNVFVNWDTLEAARAIKTHGLPANEFDRAKLIRLLRNFDDATQIPVLYRNLIGYSRIFYEAYPPSFLIAQAKKYHISGVDFEKEVDKAIHSGIEADVAEAILYAFPSKTLKP